MEMTAACVMCSTSLRSLPCQQVGCTRATTHGPYTAGSPPAGHIGAMMWLTLCMQKALCTHLMIQQRRVVVTLTHKDGLQHPIEGLDVQDGCHPQPLGHLQGGACAYWRAHQLFDRPLTGGLPCLGMLRPYDTVCP